MNVLIVNMLTNKHIQKKAEAVPPIGSSIGCFNYTPWPKVTSHLWYPPFETISKFNLIDNHVDVIVVVNGESLG